MKKFFKVSMILLLGLVGVSISGCLSTQAQEDEPTIKVKYKYPDGVTPPEYAFV